ncbi:MAG: hypothetical protein ACTS27_10855 [Phycisphaerales bacterium]
MRDDDALIHAPALFRLDPGWLFLGAGLALLAATVLIPAQDDLQKAELVLAQAKAEHAHASERLANYAEFLDALNRGDEGLMLQLAATHLNLTPADRSPILGIGGSAEPDGLIDTFAPLEPAPPAAYVRVPPDSMLYRWSTGESSRLWLLAGGSLLTLIGLLPPGASRRRRALDDGDE